MADQGAPREIGVRTLKNALSRYLAAVRDGQELIVTDRGRPIARITPVTRGIGRLAELIAEGKARPPEPDRPRFWPNPQEAQGTVSDLVVEQRE